MLSEEQVFKALFIKNFVKKKFENKMSHNNEEIKILMISL